MTKQEIQTELSKTGGTWTQLDGCASVMCRGIVPSSTITFLASAIAQGHKVEMYRSGAGIRILVEVPEEASVS